MKCANQTQDPDLLISCVIFRNAAYLSSALFVSSSPLLKSSQGETSTIQGPSVARKQNYVDASWPSVDNVLSIHCNFWPTSAAEWIERPRHYGWPSREDTDKIITLGCYLVPVGHKKSLKELIEWRLSFVLAERTLVWSFNHTQMQCYAVMKLILKEFINMQCSEEHNDVLCSFFIKTFLFWHYEKTDQSFWHSTNLSGCIKYLMNEFRKCIQTGSLWHYFIPSYNLLEVKLTREAQTELLQLYDIVIQSDMTTLAQCSSLSDIWSQFLKGRDRANQIITTRRIWENEEQIMCIIDRLRGGVSDGSLHHFFTLDKMLVALDALVDIGEIRTSLPLFAIKQVCQLITVKNVYDLRHGNKSRYNRITNLDKNVYGADIASSKLWLATFWLQHGNYRRSLQNINDVLSAIPPYAFYFNEVSIRTNIDSIRRYNDIYSNDSSDFITKAREAWLIDIYMTQKDYDFVPRAIQIELNYCDPEMGILISPFTYAYYLMFLSYDGLEQYDNRDRALRQLIDTVNDNEKSTAFQNTECNITGHCLLMTGQLDMARDFFVRSAQISKRVSSVFDKYNAAYIYLSHM